MQGQTRPFLCVGLLCAGRFLKICSECKDFDITCIIHKCVCIDCTDYQSFGSS